ncbi:MAG: glycoside hydrolase family 3 N-terminal domain-containing protein [Synechococcus sp.]
MARTLDEATLRRQVASLLVVRASGHAGDRQRRYPRWELTNAELKRLLANGVGGVILLGGSSVELQQRCLQLRDWAGGPLLLCADVEEGVGQRFEGATWLVPPMALARLHASNPDDAETLAEHYGRCTGRQARHCGLNWVLAPIVDVNNNPANPVINVRAWGEDPTTVTCLTLAFQRGLAQHKVLACAKHFPGHGDTAVDSHLQLPVLPHNRDRLEQLELAPFRAAIAAGVDSVMTAHLQIPALDPNHPATLSNVVLNDLLRSQLGFQGLVVTDALVMEAIRAHYSAGEAAVLAFAAGADLILMPEDADAAITAICDGLRSGRIPWKRLNDSMERRRNALAKVESEPDLHSGGLELETPEERALHDALLQASWEHQGPRLQPLKSGQGINLVRIDSVLACPQLPATAPALQQPEQAGFRPLITHPLAVSIWDEHNPTTPLAIERLGTGPVLVQLFLRGNPFRAGQEQNEPWGAALDQLQAAGRLAGLVIYGSPYAWDTLRTRLAPSIPAAYCPGQMPDAQAMVLRGLINSMNTTILNTTGMDAGPGAGFTD